MSKPCQQSKRLSAYLDGELSQVQSDAVKAHLDTCAECQRVFEILRHNDTLVRDLPVMEPSADFDRTFWKKVDALEAGTHRPSWVRSLFGGWRPVWAGAMAGLVVAALIYSNTTDPLTPEEVFIAEHMELLEEFDLIGQLDMLEHMEATEAMKELT